MSSLVAAAFAGLTGGLTLLPAEAPATIAEQRARLPPPATCQDPVAGEWKSHDYDSRHVDWTIFTLVIERVPGSESALVGSIKNHTWYAEKGQSEPPACAGNLEYIVGMEAEGTFVDGSIYFGGVGQWRVDDMPCGSFTMGIPGDFVVRGNVWGTSARSALLHRNARCRADHRPAPGLQRRTLGRLGGGRVGSIVDLTLTGVV